MAGDLTAALQQLVRAHTQGERGTEALSIAAELSKYVPGPTRPEVPHTLRAQFKRMDAALEAMVSGDVWRFLLHYLRMAYALARGDGQQGTEARVELLKLQRELIDDGRFPELRAVLEQLTPRPSTEARAPATTASCQAALKKAIERHTPDARVRAVVPLLARLERESLLSALATPLAAQVQAVDAGLASVDVKYGAAGIDLVNVTSQVLRAYAARGPTMISVRDDAWSWIGALARSENTPKRAPFLPALVQTIAFPADTGPLPKRPSPLLRALHLHLSSLLPGRLGREALSVVHALEHADDAAVRGLSARLEPLVAELLALKLLDSPGFELSWMLVEVLGALRARAEERTEDLRAAVEALRKHQTELLTPSSSFSLVRTLWSGRAEADLPPLFELALSAVTTPKAAPRRRPAVTGPSWLRSGALWTPPPGGAWLRVGARAEPGQQVLLRVDFKQPLINGDDEWEWATLAGEVHQVVDQRQVVLQMSATSRVGPGELNGLWEVHLRRLEEDERWELELLRPADDEVTTRE